MVHGQFAKNNNAESLKAWKLRRNVQKPNLTIRSLFGFRRFFFGVKVFGEQCGHDIIWTGENLVGIPRIQTANYSQIN